jgi:hypothetical protein
MHPGSYTVPHPLGDVTPSAETHYNATPGAERGAVLACKATVVIGGAGTDQALADRLGVAYLYGNPVAAADALTAQIAG